MFDLKTCDLNKLNSATKYPSIPTYHILGERGILTNEYRETNKSLILTEKIDGTNSRVIVLPKCFIHGGYVIGSREELLHARGDIISNPSMGIVAALKETAEKLVGSAISDTTLVFYFETYGDKTTAASKNYTGDKKVGFRLFDVAKIPSFTSLLAENNQEQLASWRENGGQSFLDANELKELAIFYNLELAPQICIVDKLPTDIEETYKFLVDTLPRTTVALDDNAKMSPEGLIARTSNRDYIVKIRNEDYERTIKKMSQKKTS